MLVGGCSPSLGPNRVELASALQTSPSNIRALRCHDIPEEPTEFGCSYRERDASGAWTPQEVMVAIDGSAWVIIDGPGGPLRP
jgi:hypothetical protein